MTENSLISCDTVTVRTCIRIKRGWTKPIEKQVTIEQASELYRWFYNHKKDSFHAAAIGQEVLVNLYGTMTQLVTIWKSAGLSDTQIENLPFWEE